MKRRTFLQASTLLGVPVIINGIPVQAIGRNSFLEFVNPDNDKILVLIQLNGGSDGLNMVLPLDQYSNLSAVRSKILIPETLGLKLTEKTALHPAMTGLKKLYDNAELKIVHSVGYPDQNRSHFRSTDIWTSGSSAAQVETTGWLGRYYYNDYSDYPNGYPNANTPDPLALTIGSQVTQTCQGKVANYSLAINDPASMRLLPVTPTGSPSTKNNYTNELEFLNNTFYQTNAYTQLIQDANTKAGGSPAASSGNVLLDRLLVVSRLIQGGLKTKVYVVGIGGFDTHANQCDPDNHEIGTHADLLSLLSGAIEGFQAELTKNGLNKRVMGMTFSEFGRRIKANDSTGTDHGSAAPLIMFGSCVNPGLLGDNPTISSNVGNDEGVAMQYDFRSVYASVLTDWFEVDPIVVREILFKDFQKLPIADGCLSTTIDDAKRDFNFNFENSPNPAMDFTTLRFSTRNEVIRISLFNSIGAELQVIHSGKMSEGDHELNINTSDLKPGNYCIRISSDSAQKTKLFVKI